MLTVPTCPDCGSSGTPRKEGANRRKHGITFEEAETVFRDERALLISDPDHSMEEDRFLLIGLSDRVRVLVVSHCYRAEPPVIRLISARKATRTEAREYISRFVR